MVQTRMHGCFLLHSAWNLLHHNCHTSLIAYSFSCVIMLPAGSDLRWHDWEHAHRGCVWPRGAPLQSLSEKPVVRACVSAWIEIQRLRVMQDLLLVHVVKKTLSATSFFQWIESVVFKTTKCSAKKSFAVVVMNYSWCTDLHRVHSNLRLHMCVCVFTTFVDVCFTSNIMQERKARVPCVWSHDWVWCGKHLHHICCLVPLWWLPHRASQRSISGRFLVSWYRLPGLCINYSCNIGTSSRLDRSCIKDISRCSEPWVCSTGHTSPEGRHVPVALGRFHFSFPL